MFLDMRKPIRNRLQKRDICPWSWPIENHRFSEKYAITLSKPILLMGVKKILEKILKSIFRCFPGTLDPQMYARDFGKFRSFHRKIIAPCYPRICHFFFLILPWKSSKSFFFFFYLTIFWRPISTPGDRETTLETVLTVFLRCFK